MFSPQCHSCSKSLTSSVRNGATIARLLLLCGICSALTIPTNVVLSAVTMGYFDIPFPFITTVQGFNLIHVAVYLSIIFHQYRKTKRRPAADDDDEKHSPNGYESAYLTLFEIPHIVVAYLDALVWTLALGMALIPYDIELHYLIYHKTYIYLRPEERVNEERLTLFVYEHLFLAIGAGAAWAVAIIATMERRRKKRSIVADIA